MTAAATADAAAAVACDAILARLLTLHPKAIDLSLDRVHRLLAALGHPERALPPVVHVAGTNGKGSVIAYLRALLETAGYAVHVHISPHLVRFNERIRLTGRLISDQELEALLAECEAANGGAPITFFEITTGAALLAFARHPADAVILETGLGGRLDATNVVDRPLVTAITPISLDHQQFLGDTVELIAAEKAGIMKTGVPCVIGPQLPAVRAVLEAKAQAVGAPLLVHGVHWQMTELANGFRLRFPDGTEAEFPPPALPGRHQFANAAQALVCLWAMKGFTVSPDHRRRGLAAAEWPARLQRLTRGPLVDALPKGWELWLDGGHNAGAAEIIAGHAAEAWAGLPLHLVCGMINSKDPAAFFRPLAARAADVTAVTIPGEANSLSAEALAGAAIAQGIAATTAPSVSAALRAVAAQGGGPARVLICGSLYLAGTVLRDNG